MLKARFLLPLSVVLASAVAEAIDIPSDTDKGKPAQFWSSTRVTLEAKGQTLRAVFAGLFDSAKIAYAVDPALDAPIYASLKEATLGEVVLVLGRLAEFDVRSEGGVVYVLRRIAKPTPKLGMPNVPLDPLMNAEVPGLTGAISGQPFRTPLEGEPRLANPVPAIDPPKIKLIRRAAKEAEEGEDVLDRKVSTRLNGSTLRAVFAELSRQTRVPIVINASVKDVKMDAVLRPTTLRAALAKLTEATHLRYRLVNGTIRINGTKDRIAEGKP
ncbi:MAG: hypothetical protein C4320_04190 [Armatimonadota bacterium]